MTWDQIAIGVWVGYGGILLCSRAVDIWRHRFYRPVCFRCHQNSSGIIFESPEIQKRGDKQ